jgi:glycosyltransferase involved in cell wall biosynthesis
VHVADVTVVVQDPAFGGGGVRQAEVFVAAARELGHSTRRLYVAHPTFQGRRLTVRRVEALRQLLGARDLTPDVRAAEQLWVVAATGANGFAATRSGRPYDVWLGTSLDDEWRGRAPGLSPSRRVAQSANAPVLRRLERSLLDGARRIYATSRRSRQALAEAARLSEERIGILPLPVDLAALRPEDDETWLRRLDAPVLAFVGRAWDPRKNVELLLRALPAIRRRLPAATVRLIGEPPRGPLPDGVEATGPVAELAPHLRTASLFVLPSRQEGFGIVAAEALAAGVPVLSTPSGGPEELLERSGGGRVLGGFGTDELAEAAVELLGDAGTLARMRSAGRAYVAREHAPERLRELLAAALDGAS